MNAFGGMFAAAAAVGYHHHQDPYSRMYQDPSAAAAAMHHHHHHHHHAAAAAAHHHYGHHHHGHHHGYKVPRVYFKIPRVLPYKEQREKFEADDFFKKLAREAEVRYTGYRDRPLHERQTKFQHALRDGNVEISILSTGFAFCLQWNVLENGYLEPHANTRIDFHKERGKVYLDAPLIVNGLSVRWKGYINMEKLDGVGGFRFDDDSARVEDLMMQQQVESYRLALRDWEEQQQRYRAALQARQAAAAAAQAAQESSSSSGEREAGASGAAEDSQQQQQQQQS